MGASHLPAGPFEYFSIFVFFLQFGALISELREFELKSLCWPWSWTSVLLLGWQEIFTGGVFPGPGPHICKVYHKRSKMNISVPPAVHLNPMCDFILIPLADKQGSKMGVILCVCVSGRWGSVSNRKLWWAWEGKILSSQACLFSVEPVASLIVDVKNNFLWLGKPNKESIAAPFYVLVQLILSLIGFDWIWKQSKSISPIEMDRRRQWNTEKPQWVKDFLSVST